MYATNRSRIVAVHSTLDSPAGVGNACLFAPPGCVDEKNSIDTNISFSTPRVGLGKLALESEEVRHSIPIGGMGNYQEAIRRRVELRSPRPESERQPMMFGNPFKLQKRMQNPDEVEEVVRMPGAAGADQNANGNAAVQERGRKRPRQGTLPALSENSPSNRQAAGGGDQVTEEILQSLGRGTKKQKHPGAADQAKKQRGAAATPGPLIGGSTPPTTPDPQGIGLQGSPSTPAPDSSRLKIVPPKPAGKPVPAKPAKKAVGPTEKKCFKLLRQPGRNYDELFQIIDGVAEVERRKQLVKDVINECKRFRKTELSTKLEVLLGDLSNTA